MLIGRGYEHAYTLERSLYEEDTTQNYLTKQVTVVGMQAGGSPSVACPSSGINKTHDPVQREYSNYLFEHTLVYFLFCAF